jgi:tRNA(fMet)-specific endonuclease VapC
MALYMLDTNAVSAVMRGNPLMDERLLQLDPADWCISAVTHSEICYGLSLRPEATTLIRAADAFLAVATTLAWDATAAAAHGRLRAQLRQAGTPIGDFDEMIAAHALSVGAVLVTGNERHFRRISGLAVENWISGTNS